MSVQGLLRPLPGVRQISLPQRLEVTDTARAGAGR